MIILFRNVRYSSNYDLQMKTQDDLNDLQVGIISVTPQIETVQNHEWNHPSLPYGHQGMPSALVVFCFPRGL